MPAPLRSVDVVDHGRNRFDVVAVVVVPLPALEPPGQHLARLLRSNREHRRVVLARRADLSVAEPDLHVTEIDAALAKLERHAMPRLIRPQVLRPASRLELLA
jgi:hypothetical protein